ncbi:hypothetical protein D3C71_1743580 [compost metagenome]
MLFLATDNGMHRAPRQKNILVRTSDLSPLPHCARRAHWAGVYPDLYADPPARSAGRHLATDYAGGGDGTDLVLGQCAATGVAAYRRYGIWRRLGADCPVSRALLIAADAGVVRGGDVFLWLSDAR